MRAHLAEGCHSCLHTVFARPMPASSQPPAPARPTALALVMTGVTLAVAAFTGFSILSSQPGEATPLVEHSDLGERLAAIEALEASLARRLEALSGTHAAITRQAAAVRARAADVTRMRDELDGAESRIARLNATIRRRHVDLVREVRAVETRIAHDDAITLPFAAGSRRPTGCTGLSEKAERVCRTYCDARSCTTRPGADCDRLRVQFASLTGGGVPPCGLTVDGEVKPCARDVTDTWTFQAHRGHEYGVGVDTADAASAADFCIVGSCDAGDTFSGDDEVPCSVPSGDFQCPRATFVASAEETCTVAVALCSATCATPETARYRLTVDAADVLTLVADDAVDADVGASRTAQR